MKQDNPSTIESTSGNDILPDTSIDVFLQVLSQKKIMQLVALDLSALTSITDYFVICSGSSTRQVRSAAEYVHSELKKKGIIPLGEEGVSEGQWALLDYGHVVIHIFYKPVREFFDLESLWADAHQIDVSAFIQHSTDQGDDTEDDFDE